MTNGNRINNGFYPTRQGMILTSAMINARGRVDALSRMTVMEISNTSVRYSAVLLGADEMPLIKNGDAESMHTMNINSNGDMEIDIGGGFENIMPGVVNVDNSANAKILLPADLSVGKISDDMRLELVLTVDMAEMMKRMGMPGNPPSWLPTTLSINADVFMSDYICEEIRRDFEVKAGVFKEAYKVSYKEKITLNITGTPETQTAVTESWYVRRVGAIKTIRRSDSDTSQTELYKISIIGRTVAEEREILKEFLSEKS